MLCITLILGALAGIVLALPALLLARRARTHKPPSVAHGFSALIGSIFLGFLVLFLLKNVLECYFVAFATACVIVFMVSWALEIRRAYQWMQSTSKKAKEAKS